jgi:hypothetical protein
MQKSYIYARFLVSGFPIRAGAKEEWINSCKNNHFINVKARYSLILVETWQFCHVIILWFTITLE